MTTTTATTTTPATATADAAAYCKTVHDVEYTGKKYHASENIEQVKSNLNTYGVCIVPHCLKPEHITRMNDGMWDMLETMSADFTGERPTKSREPIRPIDRKDPTTWPNIREFIPLHRFLLQHHSMGHAKYVWQIRTNKRIMTLFATLLECEKKDLVCSMDGVGIFLPPPPLPPPPSTHCHNNNNHVENLWLHTDQRFDYSKDPQTYSVQSWVTGFNVPKDGGTLVFYEGSHNLHEEFGRLFGLNRGHKADWFRLETREHYDFFESRGCTLRAIKCPAGSCVLWDSRTFHCGISGRNNNHEKRNVVYVSYQNKRKIDKKVLRKRAEAFQAKRMTTHRADKCHLFPKTPRTYGKQMQPIRPPPMFTPSEISPEMKSLIPL